MLCYTMYYREHSKYEEGPQHDSRTGGQQSLPCTSKVLPIDRIST